MSSKNYSISLIRMISFICIFSCHIMQYLNCELAFWFNVGVQIFLFISGYLYGTKNIDDTVKFYFKEFQKILIPYYTVLIPVMILHIILFNNLSVTDVVLNIFMSKFLIGGEHFWFIPYILMCYLITPLIQKLCSAIDENKAHLYVGLIGVLFIFAVSYFFFIQYYNFVWIICYVIGYFFGRYKNRIRFLKYAIFLESLLNFVQIYINYIIRLDLSKNQYYRIFCDINHVCLGITIFFILMYIFQRYSFNHRTIKRICDFSDKHSYCAYLIHQFIILGPLTLMKLTSNITINIIVIFALTILFSITAKFISDKVSKLLPLHNDIKK